MSTTWHSRQDLEATAQARLIDADVLLDIGCGIRPQHLIAPRLHICCEPFSQYAEHLQRAVEAGTLRADLILNLSWSDAIRALPPKSVDAVFLLDVIEHLDKEEGARLLAETERIVRGQIVLFTPLGYMPQPHTGTRDAWGLDGGEVQQHRSGWLPEDFDVTWDIVACRDFHREDSLGQVLEKPFGAFFAIKTLSRGPKERATDRLLQSLGAEGASITSPEVLERAVRLVRSARRVNMPSMLVPAQVALDATLALRDSWLGRTVHRALVTLRGSR